MLKYLNGVNNNNMDQFGNIINDFTTWKNNAIQKLPTPIKNVINAAGNAAKATFTVSLFAMRSAFLGLVNVNAGHVAELLEKCIRRNSPKSKIFWEDFGGNYNALIVAVNNGIKAGQPGKATPISINGSIGIALEAALAIVTPILISLIKLIKETGGTPQEEADAKALKDKAAADAQKAAAGGTLPTGTTTGITFPDAALPATVNSNLPLIIGGVAVLGLGAFLIMKKK